MSRIDEAVSRILMMKLRLGLFEDPLRGIAAQTEVGSAESRRPRSRPPASRSSLLKNEGSVLHWRRSRACSLTGPTADSLPSLNNGWTLTWQGDRPELYPKDRPTVLDAIRSRLGADKVAYVPGAEYDKEIDVAGCGGRQRGSRRRDRVPGREILCGDAREHRRPGPAGGRRSGSRRPWRRRASPWYSFWSRAVRALSAPSSSRRAASCWPSTRATRAGKRWPTSSSATSNPSGSCRSRYPRYANALLTYDHKAFEDQDTGFGLKAYQPEFDFGFGLSYTSFAYSGLAVEPKLAGADGGINVSVTVRNSGPRAGAEVVQLFLSDQVASLTPPVKRLARFAKLDACSRREP